MTAKRTKAKKPMPFLQDIIDQHSQLAAHTVVLREFVQHSPHMHAQPTAERIALAEQLAASDVLLDILARRIALWQGKAP